MDGKEDGVAGKAEIKGGQDREVEPGCIGIVYGAYKDLLAAYAAV
jgi:hypothetical protein